MRIWLFVTLTIVPAFGQYTPPSGGGSGNATSVNGAAVPASLPVAGTNSSGQVVAGILPGNLTACTALSTPAAPTVANVGTTGSTTYTYTIVARNNCGATLPSTTVSTTAGNATIGLTNYNTVTCPSTTGITSCDVYRTSSSGACQSAGGCTSGWVGNTAAGVPFSDFGLLGDQSSVPSSNTTSGVYTSQQSQSASASVTNTTMAIGVGAGSPTQSPTDTVIGNGGTGSSLVAPAFGAEPQNNTLIGYHCGALITTAREMTCIGANALASFTGGGGGIEDGLITAIGSYALTNETGSAIDLVAIGQKAGGSMAGGIADQSDVFISAHGGLYWTSGSYDTFINRAVDSSSWSYSGSGNLAIGFHIFTPPSGSGTCVTNYNTILGDYAGESQCTVDGSVFIGYDSGALNTTGVRNTYLGTYTGTTGVTNSDTFLAGYQAGQFNTASYNTLLGSASGGVNTITGVDNVGVGYQTLNHLTSGQYNVAIGAISGLGITTESNDVLVGYYTGPSLSTGSGRNVYVGYESGYSANASSAYNTGTGYGALGSNTSGQFNGCLGYDCLSTVTTGTNNSALGSATATSASGATYQTVIGSGATGFFNSSITLGRTSDATVIPGIIEGYSATGPALTVTSCTGATIGTGSNNLAGTITALPLGACTIVMTLPPAQHGWSCSVSDQTTSNLFRQSANTTTSVTFNGTSAAGDVINYGPCAAY